MLDYAIELTNRYYAQRGTLSLPVFEQEFESMHHKTDRQLLKTARNTYNEDHSKSNIPELREFEHNETIPKLASIPKLDERPSMANLKTTEDITMDER